MKKAVKAEEASATPAAVVADATPAAEEKAADAAQA